jgi:hypothetical protein
MYSDGIVICLLPVGTHEFSPLGKKQYQFLVDIQGAKKRYFFGKSTSSST